MSEKIFRLLVHLYPSHFRQEYGEEAVPLFRDRTRDETGVWPSVRLWFDLLTGLSHITSTGVRPHATRGGRCFRQDLFGRHTQILCVRKCISRTAATATRRTVVID